MHELPTSMQGRSIHSDRAKEVGGTMAVGVGVSFGVGFGVGLGVGVGVGAGIPHPGKSQKPPPANAGRVMFVENHVPPRYADKTTAAMLHFPEGHDALIEHVTLNSCSPSNAFTAPLFKLFTLDALQ